MTKNNQNQYQYIILAVIVQKVYINGKAKATANTTPVKYTYLDKFVLQTINRLAYKLEVSKSLTTSDLLSFLNYYSHHIQLQYIN